MSSLKYYVNDLGVLPGGTESVATGINDACQVVGWSDVGGGIYHCFLYSDGLLVDITPLGQGLSLQGDCSPAINSKGQVCGNWTAPNANTNTGFRWTPSTLNGQAGKIEDIGLTAGASASYAYDINDTGLVVGGLYTSQPNNPLNPSVHHIMIYTGGTPIDLGQIGDNDNSCACVVNNAGQFLVEVGVAAPYKIFICQYDGQSISAQTELTDQATEGLAITINNADPVSSLIVPVPGALVYIIRTEKYPANGEFKVLDRTPLPSSIGGLYQAYDLNDWGQVVGSATGNISLPSGDKYPAYIWNPSGINGTVGDAYDLNTMIDPKSGWLLCCARGINNKGHIVGEGLYQNQRRAFLLTPDSSHQNTIDRYTIEITALLGLLAKLPDPDPGPLLDMLKGLASYKLSTSIQNKEGLKLRKAALNLVSTIALQESKKLGSG
jgi:probable HAF family extracellular repeat protein